MKYIILLIIGFSAQAQIIDLKIKTIQDYLESREKVLAPVFATPATGAKGLACWTLGEVEILTKELIELRQTFGELNRKEKEKSNELKNLLPIARSIATAACLISFFLVAEKDRTKKLSKSYHRYQNQLENWTLQYTPANWSDLFLKKSLSQYLHLALGELNAIALFGDNASQARWKPQACRALGLASIHQDLANALLPETLKATVAYSEVVKSKMALKLDVCDGIRLQEKFNKEVVSWRENLKFIISILPE